jgi:hypothetical protein
MIGWKRSASARNAHRPAAGAIQWNATSSPGDSGGGRPPGGRQALATSLPWPAVLSGIGNPRPARSWFGQVTAAAVTVAAPRAPAKPSTTTSTCSPRSTLRTSSDCDDCALTFWLQASSVPPQEDSSPSTVSKDEPAVENW